MNEFAAKKLGEVLAFAEVGNDTITKGKEALISVLGEEKVNEVFETNQNQADKLLALARNLGVEEITNKKAQATGEKLKKMRDLYVGDEWDNSTELLEWSGFFHGAAIVHWSLVLGVSQTVKNDGLSSLADEGINLHEDLISTAKIHLQNLGESRAQG